MPQSQPSIFLESTDALTEGGLQFFHAYHKCFNNFWGCGAKEMQNSTIHAGVDTLNNCGLGSGCLIFFLCEYGDEPHTWIQATY